jgi:hypothetical protein
MLWIFDEPSFKWLSYQVFDELQQLLPQNVIVEEEQPVILEEEIVKTSDLEQELIYVDGHDDLQDYPQVDIIDIPEEFHIGNISEDVIGYEIPEVIETEIDIIETNPELNEVLIDTVVSYTDDGEGQLQVYDPPMINMVETENPEAPVVYLPVVYGCCHLLVEMDPVPLEEPVIEEEVVPVLETEVKVMNTNMIPDVQVTLYPNPVFEHAYVVISGLDTFQGTFTLLSTDGKVVKQVQVNATEFNVERGGLASGTYFYSVSNAGGVVGTGKVILEK